MSGFSGASWAGAHLPQDVQIDPLMWQKTGQANLLLSKGQFELDASQQKQAQEQQINALAPRILAGDQAAYEQAIAIDPVRTQAIRSGNQEYDIRGAANARADVASGLAVNRDQRDLESHISTMSDAQRRRAEENIGIMARIGGSLMTTYPDTASRTAAWPAARADIMRLTGNDPGEAYPGDARVQQFLTQAQSAPDLFKNATTGFGAAPAGFYGGPGAAPAAPAPNSSGGTPPPASPAPAPASTAAPQPITSQGMPGVPAFTATPPNALQPRPQAASAPTAGPPPTAQQYAGPLGGIIKSAADKYKVAPEIVAGIVRVESGGNVNAVGPQTPTGRAYGPMQLQIATAQEMNLSPENIHEPAANINAGTGYFAKMRDKYGGNVPIALAAYNWGQRNVDRWLRTSNGDLSTLPQTVQRYIQNVTGGFAPADANQPWQSGQLPPVAPRGQLQQQTTPADLGLVGSAPAYAAYDVDRERMAADAQAFQDPMTVRPLPLDASPAPAPLPAALVGTGPLAQAANAAAAPSRLSVSGLPEGYEYAMTPQGQFYTHGAPAGKVWAWRPGDPNSKTVVDLPGAKSTEERKVAFDQADKLRDEWNKATAPFVLTQNAYNTMQRAQENPSAAGDLSMIFGFMKMLDPTSTVREGEAASVQNAGGVSDRIINLYNNIRSGERLTTDQRQDLVSQSENLFKVSKKHYDNTKEQYGNLADHFGVPRKAVLVEHARPQTDGQAGPRPAQLPTMATPADAMKLPPGTRFLDANGVERMRP